MRANEILDSEFLQVRARILEVAAAFDRMDRATGEIQTDERFKLLQQALQLTLDANDPSRAEQMQLLFSRDYDPAWREHFGLDRKRDSEN
jgi:hypothetical protein